MQIACKKAFEALELQKSSLTLAGLPYSLASLAKIRVDFQAVEQLKAFVGRLTGDEERVFYGMLKCVQLAGQGKTERTGLWFRGVLFLAQGKVTFSSPEEGSKKKRKEYETGAILGIKRLFRQKPLSFWELACLSPSATVYVLEKSALEECVQTAPLAATAIQSLIVEYRASSVVTSNAIYESAFTSPNTFTEILTELDDRQAGHEPASRPYYEFSPSLLRGKQGEDVSPHRSALYQKPSSLLPLQALPVLLPKDDLGERAASPGKKGDAMDGLKHYKSEFLNAKVAEARRKEMARSQRKVQPAAMAQKEVDPKWEAEAQREIAETAKQEKELMLDEYRGLCGEKERVAREYNAMVERVEKAKREKEALVEKTKKEDELRQQLQVKQRKGRLVQEINENRGMLESREFFNKQLRLNTRSATLAKTVFPSRSASVGAIDTGAEEEREAGTEGGEVLLRVGV